VGRLALLMAIGLMGGTFATQPASAQAPANTNDQCSVAIVSRFVDPNAPTCDLKTAERMAKTGNLYQQNQLGIASMLALGPDFSKKDALAWFQQAAQRGYPPAEVNLAVMYINGWGVPTNYGTAQLWLRRAADQHFARAYYNLGILYLEGKGVHQDNAEAFHWFQKGAEAGDSSAQTNLGYMYDLGLGCERNIRTAAQWYQKAADAGNPLGENNLADLYLRGEGVAQDDAQAFHWFQKAADQGHTGARIKLGYMYAEGRGTAKDPQTAYFWISAASAAGDNRGRELQHVLEQQLNAKQIAEAHDRVNHLQQGTPMVPASSFVQ
jgi:uncharacterized protein